MALSSKRAADSKMAGMLAAAGIERTATKGSQRCPVCNHMVTNAAFYNHIATHK